MRVAQERRRWAVVLDLQRKSSEDYGGTAVDFRFRDLLAVQERTIASAEIGDDAMIAVDPKARMPAGDARIVDRQIADCSGADARIPRRQRMPAGLAVTREDEREH